MILLLAWRNIWRNKRRTLITVMMVFIAVFLSTVMRSLQLGTYHHMIDGLVRYTSGYLQVQPTGYDDDKSLDRAWSADTIDLQGLKQNRQVESVAPRLEGFALGSYGKKTKPLSIIGLDVDLERETLELNKKIKSGALPSNEQRGIMVGQKLAEKLGLGVGDSLVLLGQGYQAQTAAGLYRVEAILLFANPLLNENTVFMPLQWAQELFSTGKRITHVVINISPNAHLQTVQHQLTGFLPNVGFSLLNWQELNPELYQGIQGDQSGGMLIIFILYMVIAFGIFGTILMMTTERQYEYGVLNAIGMRRFALANMLVIETALLALLGAVVSLAVAAPVVAYFHHYPIRFSGQAAESMNSMGFEAAMYASTDFVIGINQALVVTLISMALCAYPFIKLQWLKPVAAMKK
ncbi:MAG: ABC transporter permease [Bacteroidetes bacterium]|nr:ABC transporter permease [Bacteroidota bacterium]